MCQLGTPPGMGRGGGALLGTWWGQTKGKVWLCPAVAWSPLAPGGGIFVLYFIHVSFPEPGSSVYHPETAIKNKPLAVFFSGLSACPEQGQGPTLLPLCCQCCSPLGPAVGSCSMPLGQVWLSYPLAALRPATARCTIEPSGSSGTQHGSLNRGCSITPEVVQAPAPPAPWAPWLCCGRPGG